MFFCKNCRFLDPIGGDPGSYESCAVVVSLASYDKQARATEPLTGSGWQMSLSGLNLPKWPLTGQREDITSRQREGELPTQRPAVCGEGSVSAAPSPFRSSRAMGPLSQTVAEPALCYKGRESIPSGIGLLSSRFTIYNSGIQ